MFVVLNNGSLLVRSAKSCLFRRLHLAVSYTVKIPQQFPCVTTYLIVYTKLWLKTFVLGSAGFVVVVVV
uniref:Uncharacterized protein n=1 Tax=Anguilla anguilla TaxID=7936 RepID=A0A0E9PFT4_ANGAN